MKLQPASRKEVARMSLGCGICAMIELIGFLALHLFGIAHFSYRIILGTLGGTLIAIINFAMMCLMVQNAAGTEDKKLLKAKVQASYNLRLLVQAGWVAAAFFIPFVNVIAAAIPLLFPTAVIYYLQSTGKLIPKDRSAVRSETSPEEEPDPTDDLNSFEV